MHIFLDESGTFAVPADGDFSPCVIGALIIPDFKIDQTFKKYSRLRENLPTEKGEVKGRLLSEAQVAAVVDILRRNECLFEAHVIEMSLEVEGEIESHRANAAEGLTVNLTDQHKKPLVDQVWAMRGQLEQMALPLYVQYALMSDVLGDLIREIPVYWAQRRMKELLNFHWVVDGKGDSTLTKSETWWKAMKTGLLQSRLAREPMIALEGLDYAEFDAKFRTSMPEYLKETILPYEEGFSLNLLMDESFRFSSGVDFGLELVDILTNATRRALKGNLSEAGWSNIPKLMIHQRGQYIKMKALSESAKPKNLPYGGIIVNEFARGGRDMLTKKSRA